MSNESRKGGSKSREVKRGKNYTMSNQTAERMAASYSRERLSPEELAAHQEAWRGEKRITDTLARTMNAEAEAAGTLSAPGEHAPERDNTKRYTNDEPLSPMSIENGVPKRAKTADPELAADLDRVHAEYDSGMKKDALDAVRGGRRATTHASEADRALLDQGAEITYIGRGSRRTGDKPAWYKKGNRPAGAVESHATSAPAESVTNTNQEAMTMEAQPSGARKTEGPNADGLGIPQERVEELKKEHAIAEESPNSKKEAEAKLEALLSKYGPAAGSSIREGGNIPSGKPSGLEKAPNFTIPDNLDGNFKYRGYEFSIPMPTGEEKPKTAAEALDRAKTNAGKTESNNVFKLEQTKLDSEVKHREMYYFSMLRRHQQDRGFWSATAARLGFKKSDKEKLPLHLQELRRGVIEARAAKAKHMLDSIDSRREARGAKQDMDRVIEKGPNKGKTYGEAMRERYKRMFMAKEVVFGFENAEQKARMDGLRSRDRNIVDRAWKWYGGLPTKTKILMSAPFIATAGAAALVGGIWPLGVVAGMGATAARLNWVAANRRERAQDNRSKAEGARGDKLASFAEGYDARAAKNDATAQKYSNAAKWVTFAGLGGMVGAGLNRFFNRKKMAAAEHGLSTKEAVAHGHNYRSYGGDFSNPNALEGIMNERSNAAAKKGKYENQQGTARGVGALVGGVAGGAALGGAFHHFGAGHAHMEDGGGGTMNGAPSGDPIAQAHHGFTAEINRHGEGADLLYRDMRGQLEQAYAGHTPPPVVAELLKYKDMDQFSRATGFEYLKGADVHGAHAHIDSAVMHMHDKFVLSPDGKTFSLVDAKGNATVLMQETPQHGAAVMSHTDGWIPVRDYSHQGAPQHAETPAAAVRGDTAGDAKVASLNAAETAKSAPAPAPAPIRPEAPPSTDPSVIRIPSADANRYSNPNR